MATVSMMAYPVRDSFQSYPQQYAIYQQRTQSHENVAHSMNANQHYESSSTPQQYLQQQSRSPLPSEPLAEDGSRPLLPSISNLLVLADGDRPSQDNGTRSALRAVELDANIHIASEQAAQSQAQQSQYAHQPAEAVAPAIEQRKQVAPFSQDQMSSQRTAIPPTPPFRNDSAIEATNSPSTISTGSSLSVGQPYYVGSALNNVEASDQRAMVATEFVKRHSVPSHVNASPYGASQYSLSPYVQSPGAISSGSYYSPTDPSYPGSGLYQQRPLPSTFPPQPAMPAQSRPSVSEGGLWQHQHQHHHYISPQSQATFPQSQDRYICQTCNKAFSRPSSLKIHSHSHTGEKPFKCAHAGCGKSFSVRSNMKRHERGCHTGVAAMVGSSLLV